MRSERQDDGQGAAPETPLTIRVRCDPRGRWEVSMPDRDSAITCETLDEARRVAYLAVAHGRSCELIVQDAYHRVVHRELIAGHRSSSPASEQPEPPTPAGHRLWRERPPAVAAKRRRRPGRRKRCSPTAATKQPTTNQGGQ